MPITLASPGAIAFHVASLTVRWYGIMIASGFLAATAVMGPLAKRRGINPDELLNCCLATFMGGILGARLYFVALSWPTFAVHPEQILATWLGGLSIHGGIIGGFITGWCYCKLNGKLPFLRSCDVAASILPLAQAVGRWGNFFNSEAFGGPVPDDFPIRLYIPPQSRPLQFADKSYFHATFLYESVWDLAVFFLLYFFLSERLKNYPGMNFLAYIFLYSVGRAIIEPIRVDSIMVGGYAAPSVVSNALLIASALAMVGLGVFYKRKANQQKANP